MTNNRSKRTKSIYHVFECFTVLDRSRDLAGAGSGAGATILTGSGAGAGPEPE